MLINLASEVEVKSRCFSDITAGESDVLRQIHAATAKSSRTPFLKDSVIRVLLLKKGEFCNRKK